MTLTFTYVPKKNDTLLGHWASLAEFLQVWRKHYNLRHCEVINTLSSEITWWGEDLQHELEKLT